MNFLTLFKPGDIVYGYCNGLFGRDDYETKTVISVRPKYVLFEYESGLATVLNGHKRSWGEITKEMVDEWKKLPEDQEV